MHFPVPKFPIYLKLDKKFGAKRRLISVCPKSKSLQ